MYFGFCVWILDLVIGLSISSGFDPVCDLTFSGSGLYELVLCVSPTSALFVEFFREL